MTLTRSLSTEWRRGIVGVEKKVPLLNGQWIPYVNLDNAATTPALVAVRDQVNEFLEWYSSVHRGTGYKSRIATEFYEEARRTILQFVHGDDDERTAVFTKNTTESINLLANTYLFQPNDVVLLTPLEHHANLLPWRGKAVVEYIRLDHNGLIDLDDLETLLRHHQGKVRLVSVSGASNVTGYTPPIYEIARLAHSFGADIMVDAAQLAPHRSIDMRPLSDPAHIDYLVFSGHKMYAPYGAGVLIGLRAGLEQNPPLLRGGGAVKFVTLDSVDWDVSPERDEAGSPNVLGALALATAVKSLSAMNMSLLEEREMELSHYLYRKLREIPKLNILGDVAAMKEQRIGVMTFVIEDIPSMLAASVIGYEWGIGVRAGCFCAHPYLMKLLKVSDSEAQLIRNEIVGGDRTRVPTALRVSLGLYNSEAEIDQLAAALHAVIDGSYSGSYQLNKLTGEYELQVQTVNHAFPFAPFPSEPMLG